MYSGRSRGSESARSSARSATSSRMISARGYGGAEASAPSRPAPSRRPPAVYFPEVGNYTLTGIPGYGGYIPGKISENVIGSTFNRSNQLAAIQCEERVLDDGQYTQQPHNYARHNPFGITLPHKRGTDIPGYTGFIPGKYADGVFGHVYARSNNVSQLLKQRQYVDRSQWIGRLFNE
ncbi:unnamed protein product [Amoebophrya sp. A25]|nr:unnamed protein product [Amoebophrya sp. A25]|eukprot:GSA25T00007888001.1